MKPSSFVAFVVLLAHGTLASRAVEGASKGESVSQAMQMPGSAMALYSLFFLPRGCPGSHVPNPAPT